MPATASRLRRVWSRKQSPAAHAPADHGQVAYLPDGTAATVWSWDGPTNRRISCRITRFDPNRPESILSEQVLDLALAGTSVFEGGESCEKPWISRLSETEFFVSWERQATAAASGQVEGARLFFNGTVWEADMDAGGVGWALGTGNHGDADMNVRSCFVENGYVAISYAVETANSGTTPHERTYTKRVAVIPWLTAGDPSAGAITAAIANQHMDDDDAAPIIQGGFMLSTIRVTSRRDLFVAWENRDWNGANFENTIKYQIRAGLYHATPLTSLETGTILSLTDDDAAYRRPAFDCIHPDEGLSIPTGSTGGTEMVWVFGAEDVDDPERSNAGLGVLTLYGGAALAESARDWNANSGLNANRRKLGSACAVMGRTLRCGIAVANYDADAGRTLSVMHTDGAHEFLPTSVRWPDRPYGCCWTAPNGKDYLFLTYEGFNDDGGDADRWLDLYEVVKE